METLVQGDKASIFTKEQEDELRNLKAHFPYRIVWGAVDINGEFYRGADVTRHKLNRFLRRGYLVATIGE